MEWTLINRQLVICTIIIKYTRLFCGQVSWKRKLVNEKVIIIYILFGCAYVDFMYSNCGIFLRIVFRGLWFDVWFIFREGLHVGLLAEITYSAVRNKGSKWTYVVLARGCTVSSKTHICIRGGYFFMCIGLICCPSTL